ncbi:MAG: T9SS type A sorting domain-containing protein [Gemmatimonadetes bacterium]|nr:T9SS type A sorting domain-containing protein [Gemmatimonadota bacterium]
MKKASLFNVALVSVSVLFAPASRAQDYTRWNLPEGALARLGKGRAKTGQATAAVYSADGTRLAVNTNIGIWLYDTYAGAEFVLIPERDAEVMALSSDGSTLASISGGFDNAIELWDVDSGQLKATLEGNQITSVAFSPDGATLASGSWDTTIRLWDVDSEQLKAILKGHMERINSVSFSPNGATLASGSNDTTIRLWDVDSGQLKAILKGHKAQISSMSFSPDGTTLASGSWDTTIRLWDVDSGQLKAILKGHKAQISSMSFSPDGTTLASGSWDTTIRLWDVDSGQIQNTQGLRALIYSVLYTPDGASLIVASGYGALQLWDTDSGQMQGILPGHTIWVSSVAFSPDGSTLASAHGDKVRLWDVDSGQFKDLKGHTGSVYSVSFSPDGSALASSSLTIRLWDVDSGQMQNILHRGIWTGSVVFSPDGSILASGHGDGKVRLWDADSDQAEFIFPQGDTGAVFSVTFSPDGSTLASGHRDGKVRLWDVDSGQLKASLEGHADDTDNWITSVAFSPDGATLVGSGSDGALQLWDVDSGQFKASLEGNHITSIAFSPDGATLAGGSWDDTLRLWDTDSGQLKASLKGHADRVSSVAFSPDGTILASGSNDGTILLWDLLNIPDPPVDISVPLGFAVEQWSWLEPVAMDLIANREYGTGIMGATILNAASDNGAVLLWRYSAGREDFVARIPAELVNAVPTVRFDQTGVFDNKLFVTINAGPDGRRKTRVVIVEPNGEFRDARNIYDKNSTQAFIEFSSPAGYPAGAYIYDADSGQGQSFYRLNTYFYLHLIASHTLPADRSDIDPMDLKADPTGKYGGLLTLSDTDLNHDELSGLYQLHAKGEWHTLVPPVPVSERQFQGIAFSNAGPLGSALYVADAVTDNIWIASPKGHIEAFAVGFTNPQRIAIGPEGADMWVADQTGLYRIFSTDPADWEAAKATLPVASSLESNYPNPFNSSTQIPYRVSASGPVRLVIYNVLGQPMRTLVDGVQAAGAYQVPWDGRDHSGVRVASGVYLYRLQAGAVTQVRKMLVLQ